MSESQSRMDKLKMQLVALENINSGIEAKEMNYLMQVLGLKLVSFTQTVTAFARHIGDRRLFNSIALTK